MGDVEKGYWIFSIQHNQWWKENKHGYTSLIEEAGKYSLKEAIKICHDANQYKKNGDLKDEIYILAYPLHVKKEKNKKEQREKNLSEFNPENWSCFSEYHYYKIVAGKRLDYWPSTKKFMYDGKVHTGDVEGFIRNRRIEDAS